MSTASLGFWTWIAIGVLLIGSVAVFFWFLADAVRLFRSLQRDAPDAGTTARPRDVAASQPDSTHDDDPRSR